jgi:hypothetical protein
MCLVDHKYEINYFIIFLFIKTLNELKHPLSSVFNHLKIVASSFSEATDALCK